MSIKVLIQRLRSPIAKFYRVFFPEASLRRTLSLYKASNPYVGKTEETYYEGSGPYTMGIIKDFAQWHKYYIDACLEMDISYKVLDIFASNWQEIIRESNCDALLVWPPAIMTIHKQMFDERLKVAQDCLGKIVFPTYDELWMWESKRRMAYWLTANRVPTPKTWTFYDLDEALDFVDKISFPVVIKTDYGDSAKGVWIIKNRRDARKHIKKAFSSGHRFTDSHRCDIQWGNVIFQQYIENRIEWRLIRVGDSYFGYHKKQIGDFASGFGQAIFGDIPRHLLELIHELTEKHRFYSMSMDVLVDNDGKYYVTEMQSLFGDTVSHRKLVIDGKPGRYIYNKQNKTWLFEEGIFDQNICCNLRVEHVIKLLEQKNAGN